MKNRIVLFLISFIVWSLLNWPLDWQHTVVGVLACAFIAFVLGDFFIVRAELFSQPKRYIYFAVWLIVLAIEAVKANIYSACRIIKPDLSMNAGMIKFNTVLTKEISLTLFANSINLAGKALCVDVDKDKQMLYLYCLEMENEAVVNAVKNTAQGFEKIIQKVFE